MDFYHARWHNTNIKDGLLFIYLSIITFLCFVSYEFNIYAHVYIYKYIFFFHLARQTETGKHTQTEVSTKSLTDTEMAMTAKVNGNKDKAGDRERNRDRQILITETVAGKKTGIERAIEIKKREAGTEGEKQ